MKSFRVRTDLGVQDTNIKFKLDQTFDNLEILSLKINQNNFYRTFTSEYGVLVGRVIGNGGVGVPNTYVSVFVPLDEVDSEDPNIVFKYPYKQVTDKNDRGIRYNLLPKNSKILKVRKLKSNTIKPATIKNQVGLWLVVKIGIQEYWETSINTGYGPETAVGTFDSSEDITSNDDILYIYQKYYKYVTKTNNSGDYMIFGVPIGQQSIHMDLDLSDIGKYSFTASELIANGYPAVGFNSVNGVYNFKSLDSLEELPQVITANHTVNIIPLWGDPELSEIGITRHDFEIQFTAQPVAYLAFNILHDQIDKDYLYNDSHDRIANVDAAKAGYGPGQLAHLRTNQLSNIQIESVEFGDNGEKIRTLNQNSVYNRSTGECVVLLPCTSSKYVTDEFGNSVPSDDPNKGVGTTGNWNVRVNPNTPLRYKIMLLQKSDKIDESKTKGSELFYSFKANNIYSVKMTNNNRYSIRKDYGHRGDHTGNQITDSEGNEWVNGIIYLGRGYFEGSRTTGGNSYPRWLAYDTDYYNVNHYIIDVTDYIGLLLNGRDREGSRNDRNLNGNKFKTIFTKDMGTIITDLKKSENLPKKNGGSYAMPKYIKYDTPGNRGNGTDNKDRYMFFIGNSSEINVFKTVKELKG